MTPSARMVVITNLATKQAHLDKKGQSSNEFLPPLPLTEQRTNFFSEFSEVNGAFWNLREKLKTSHADDRVYYLDGQQPDSLSGLARALGAADQVEHVSVVVRYLTLLSMNEVLVAYPPTNDHLLRDVKQMIIETEDNEEFNTIPDKADFLNWIKEKFSMPIIQIDSSTKQLEQNNADE
jgi:hypothetical protein